MTPVRLSPKAEQDIEEIGDYIARDHPARALAFVDALRTACLAIGRSPEGFQPQPDIGPAIRRAVHGRYLIFYTAHEHEVRIERVLHGARDITPDVIES